MTTNVLLNIFVSLLLISCGRLSKSQKPTPNEKNTTISIYLPDTLSINGILKGHIEFEEILNPLPNQKIYKKYTFLYATFSKKKINSFFELIKIPHDTFVPIDNSIIPVYNLNYSKRGNILFEGFVVDQFFYKTAKDSIRIVNQERKISYPIKVY